MSEEVLLISNLTAQCKWLLRAISDRLLGDPLLPRSHYQAHLGSDLVLCITAFL